MINPTQLTREKLLFRYGNALERGDFDALAALLDAAHNDPLLERMILDLHQAYLIEMQNITVSVEHVSSPQEIQLNARPAKKSSWNPPFTLAVAAMITIVFSVILIVNGLRHRADITGVFRSVEDINTANFVRYIEEGWNRGNVDVLDEVLTADHVRHDSGFSDDIVGIEANAQLITGFRTALPDLHLDVEDMTADGDEIWAYMFLSGTHTGELVLPDGASIAPTGAAVSIRMMVISRFVDGKIAELRAEYDGVGWLQQMGAIPALQQLATEAQNLAIARRVIDELWNGENLHLDTVRELYAMPFTFHKMNNPYAVTDTIGGLYDYFMNLHSALPDIHLTVDDLSARGDLVVAHYSLQGTHSGDMLGRIHNVQIPPSGQAVSWDGVMIYRIQDGKIVEEWWYWDNEYITRAELEGELCVYATC
jgi:predicted ester cyclase